MTPNPNQEPEKYLLRLALANDLRVLSSLPQSSFDDVEAWSREAEAFRLRLYSVYGSLSSELPHELEHYLTDSDIRLKDAGYGARQNKFVSQLVDRLRDRPE